MATLKHIASKNSDYTAIEAYLIYQHDEFTGKQLLDEQGRPMLRESYILDTLECGDFSFATACLLANRRYGKNTQHGDIKSHQYIISFDPRDAADNGLTMEKAQALGLKFCEENFPGHPAIVCTHPDGHNRSGNIHIHIVIGSIRMREVERKPYMQKPRDWLEGMKHSSTAQTMRHLRVEVMELCKGAGLYQIDLLNGSKERVSEAEYWARRRGQQKLDLANAALTAAGQQPKQKKFETVKSLVGARPLHLLHKPLGHSKAPLGLLLLRKREPCGNRFLRCCTVLPASKISLTSSCSSTALPSRKAVDSLAICLLAEQSSSGRNISVTSSIRQQCFPRCRQTPNANPRRSSSRIPSGNWWIFRRS